VAALVENRLLQTGREGDDTYLEIAHEALFRSWQRLVDWLEDIHDSLRLIRRTEREAQIWDERGRPEHMRPNAEELAELKSAAEQVGIGLGGELLEDFTEPEQARLPRQLEDIHLSHPERAQIGDRLAVIGDTRKGVGLRPDGVPEMMWLPVESGAVTIENERFTVEPFFVAKYLVTYQQFQVFIDAPDGYQNKQWWAGMPDDYVKQDIVEQRTKFKNNPRDNLSWYQVAAFSRWLTEQYRGEKLLHPAGEQFEIGANAVIRLPLEWEWQWAAQGGQARRKYPWGDWRDGCANTSEAGLSRAIGVGLYPQGAAVCGALDMAGQLREWCLNDYSNVSIVDYMNNEYKTQRGGSFYYFRLDAACASRNLNLPSFPDYYFGVRVIVSRPIL